MPIAEKCPRRSLQWPFKTIAWDRAVSRPRGKDAQVQLAPKQRAGVFEVKLEMSDVTDR